VKPIPVLARFDLPLLVPAALVLTFGLVSLYSIDPAFARTQLLFALFGGLCFVFVSLVNYRWLRPAALPLWAVSFALLLGVLLFGKEVGGARRWFVLGPLFFSPSELGKIALVVLLSASFADASPPLKIRSLAVSIVPVAVLSALAFLQPSLGTAVIFCFIWAGLVWAAGISFRHLLACLLLVGISLPVAWGNLEDYQRARVAAFLNPVLDPLGAGYNVIQSLIAVGSGQFLGKGLGMGTQSRLQFLPVRHTDFIFASLTEEWGFLGAGILLALLGALLWRILKIAFLCQDRFGLLLGVGIFTFLFAQTVVNVGMNIGIAPVTGLPLPLVSYGGSSLLSTFVALGLVNSLAIHRDV